MCFGNHQVFVMVGKDIFIKKKIHSSTVINPRKLKKKTIFFAVLDFKHLLRFQKSILISEKT